MSTVSTPVVAYVAALMSYAGANQSASLTATCQVTAGWELRIPIQWSHSPTVSADAVVNVYASDDGVTFDTQPFQAFGLQRVASGGGGSYAQGTLVLTTGVYCLQMLNPGPNSAFFGIPTAQVLTAVVNA